MPETPAAGPVIAFDNAYARLPERFYARQAPVAVVAPALIRVNTALAQRLGLDAVALASPAGVSMLAGNTVPVGAEPMATAYAGHQFGGFSPQLGDGRAILLGEVIAPDGARFDLQLKGAGRTKFSRSGDGRAALGPVLREYVVSEAMAALGVPTTRALSAVLTGETVQRETPLPGAVLCRVASSHIRVGTFQYFAVRRDEDALRELTAHVIMRHYPAAAATPNPALALLEGVIARQAALVAHWMLIGFIHGVMNTDNSSIAGETIDYGPCAFMDAFDPAAVFSSIDMHARYAYANQPAITQWNLTRLAETLVPQLADHVDGDKDRAIALAQTALDTFPGHFNAAYAAGMRRKLGLTDAHPDDAALGQDLLDIMAQTGADFTNTFRSLSDEALDPGAARSNIADAAPFQAWVARWRQRSALERTEPAARRALMRSANPAFIPRNHRLEAIIAAAVTDGDFRPFEDLLAVLAAPYEDQPGNVAYRAPPLPDEVVRATFCGT